MVILLNNVAAAGAGTACGTWEADQNLVVISGGLAAVATLTVTTPANTETVTVGLTPGVVYTFRTTLSTGPTIPNEVLVGATPSISLDNLKAAVNGAAGVGTTYSTGTVANPTVYCTTKTATTLLFVARVPGTVGNAYLSTETGATMAFGAGTFASGTQTATGSTAAVEYSGDNGTTWVTVLSIANPTMATVAATHAVNITAATHIRANVTTYVAPCFITATLQSWARGRTIN